MRLRTTFLGFSLIFFIAACVHRGEMRPEAPGPTEVAPKRADSDEQSIERLLHELFASVDRRDWPAAASLMHESIYIDYSALGGESGERSPAELTQSWANLLPGFDRTIHQPHNFAVWVAGDRATATLDAIASHYLSVGASEGERYWTVFVGYDTEFVRVADGWKLARLDISLYDQAGNAKLVQRALQRVAEGTVAPFAESSAASEPVESFFQALEARDIERLMATLDEGIVQEMPFAPRSFPPALSGKAAMRKQYAAVMDYTQRYERSYLATQDPRTVLVKFEGTITTSEGRPYNNAYVGLFTVGSNGKIVRFVEQFNPNILLAGWPGLSVPHYSVHAAGAEVGSGVTLKEVEFLSHGDRLRGHLFLPPDHDPQARYPTAVVAGSWTSVKEQMPDEYASLLAKAGVVALTFDFRGFGESEGQPRQFEDVERKIQDIRAAVDFLDQRQDVESVVGLGVCAGSGYMAHAVARDPRISRLVLIAPWLHNPEIARSIYDGRPGGTKGLLAAARDAKARYQKTGETEYVLAASELDALAAMYVPKNAFDYYLNPAKAAGPHYDNRFAVMSWEPWLTLDGISVAETIEQPVFIVHSEKGAVPRGAREFYRRLRGSKDIVWLDRFDQQQLYMDPEAVHSALSVVSEYLTSKAVP